MHDIIIIQRELHFSGAKTPANVMAVQNGSTCILLTWTADSSAGGYMIYYNGSNGYNKSVEMNNNNNDFYHYKLTEGLEIGVSYTISILATSSSRPSGMVEVFIALRKFIHHVFLVKIIPLHHYRRNKCLHCIHNRKVDFPLLGVK